MTVTLPPSVVRTVGHGGLPVLQVRAAAADAEVHLHGGQVTAWQPRGAAPVLWLSRASRFAPGSAIRGGVPICFPWFGAHADDPTAPSHGFARLLEWELVDAVDDGWEVTLVLRLEDSDATRASAWPHAFEALLEVRVGTTLRLALTVTNRSDDDVTFEEALHTYLAVADVRRASVTGLAGVPFEDRSAGPRPPEDGPVTFGPETDRIYLGPPGPLGVHDASTGRLVTVTSPDAGATVVWNPGRDRAAALADMADDEWTEFVCVESADVRAAAVRLTPGGAHTLTVAYVVTPG